MWDLSNVVVIIKINHKVKFVMRPVPQENIANSKGLMKSRVRSMWFSKCEFPDFCQDAQNVRLQHVIMKITCQTSVKLYSAPRS